MWSKRSECQLWLNDDGGGAAPTDPKLRAIGYVAQLADLRGVSGTYATHAAILACAAACEVCIEVHTTGGVSPHGDPAHPRARVLLHQGHYKYLTAAEPGSAFQSCELVTCAADGSDGLHMNRESGAGAEAARVGLAGLRTRALAAAAPLEIAAGLVGGKQGGSGSGSGTSGRGGRQRGKKRKDKAAEEPKAAEEAIGRRKRRKRK